MDFILKVISQQSGIGGAHLESLYLGDGAKRIPSLSQPGLHSKLLSQKEKKRGRERLLTKIFSYKCAFAFGDR